jgi:hypothetical protein
MKLTLFCLAVSVTLSLQSFRKRTRGGCSSGEIAVKLSTTTKQPHSNKLEDYCLLIPDFDLLSNKQDYSIVPILKQRGEEKLLTFYLIQKDIWVAKNHKFFPLAIHREHVDGNNYSYTVNIIFSNNEKQYVFSTQYQKIHLKLYSRLSLFLNLTHYHQNENYRGFTPVLKHFLEDNSSPLLRTYINKLENVANPIRILIAIDSELKIMELGNVEQNIYDDDDDDETDDD